MTCYRYAPYMITLSEPAILSPLGGDSNNSVTLPYIPGSAMRGAAAWSLGAHDAQQAKNGFAAIILDGSVRFLNAYPVNAGHRCLPVPVSMQRMKYRSQADATGATVDVVAYHGQPNAQHNTDGTWPKEPTISLEGNFLTIGQRHSVLVKSNVTSKVHTQRDRAKGRAWKDKGEEVDVSHGAIFSYESLDARQSFAGIIQIRGNTEKDCADLLSRVRDALGSHMMVGRSRRAGYGGNANVRWGEVRDREPEGQGAEGLQLLSKDVQPGDEFRILLTSPCIVRNPESGQIDPCWLPQEIAAKLGRRAEVLRQRWRFDAFGGFNRKWRLESPQALAVAAGSVFVMIAKQSIPMNDLVEVEHKGIGERKTEGFGRLILLEAPHPTVDVHDVIEEPAAGMPTGDAPALVRFIEKRVLDGQVQQRIEEIAASIAQSARNIPSTSLIGRLRTPLRGDTTSALNTLREWLGEGDEKNKRLRRPAMDGLEGCRVTCNGQQTGLDDWLRNMSKCNRDWTGSVLDLNGLAQSNYLVSEQSAVEIMGAGTESYTISLIDAVLELLALRNRREEVRHD